MATPSRRLDHRLALVTATSALAVGLVLGFKTPDELAAQGSGGSGGRQAASSAPDAASSASGGTSSSSGGTSSTAGGASTAPDTSASRTVPGPVVETRWGPVEVAVTIANGRLVDVQAIELPTGGRSGAISSYAAPILRTEALQAKSANIDVVSGATYTSEGYAQSLQAALDQAGI